MLEELIKHLDKSVESGDIDTFVLCDWWSALKLGMWPYSLGDMPSDFINATVKKRRDLIVPLLEFIESKTEHKDRNRRFHQAVYNLYGAE